MEDIAGEHNTNEINLQPFRTTDNEIHNHEESKLSSVTKDTLTKNGININNGGNISKCKENEIFLMDKNKMFLVSSEKIVHDISGINLCALKLFLLLC